MCKESHHVRGRRLVVEPLLLHLAPFDAAVGGVLQTGTLAGRGRVKRDQGCAPSTEGLRCSGISVVPIVRDDVELTEC